MKVDGSTILTASGRYVDPLDLDPEDVVISDIAHALANQCRYSGHVREFYSVAEHSVRVAERLEAIGAGPEVALAGLLHDATEAYLVDLPRPLKAHPVFGATYRQAEAKLAKVIEWAFDLGVALDHPEIHRADMILLATERRDLMPPVGEWKILDGVEPLDDEIVPWPPDKAREVFLAAFRRLTRAVGVDDLPAADLDPLNGETVTISAIFVDGEIRATASTGGQKGRKPEQFSAMPWDALLVAAKHFGYGAEKYDAHNYRRGYPWSWSFDALVRHLAAFWQGEDVDAESGSPHLAAVVFHALALLTFQTDHPDMDDRPHVLLAALDRPGE